MRRCTVHCKERENGDGAARYSSFTPLWNMLEVNAIALSCHLNLFACYVLQRIWKYIIKKVGTPSQCEHSGLGVKSKVQSGFGETINYTYCIINTAEFFTSRQMLLHFLTQDCQDIFLYFWKQYINS